MNPISPQQFNIIQVFLDGGSVMWPILGCSILVLAIAIERFFSLRRATIDTREFMDTMRTVLRQNRVQEAIEICDETAGPIARIMKAGILKHDRSKDDIREAIEDAGHLEVPRLERYLGAMATCANLATLMGLLGTITGMIKCFAAIESKEGQVNPQDLAEGIKNALITTAGGLIVAIPTIALHSYFVSRADNLILAMEISSAELVELLTKHRDDHEI